MGDFASKGVAGAGLGLGIAGTALGVLNGGWGNLLGGYGRNYGGCGYGYGGYGYGGYGVSGYADINISEALAERDAEIARLSAKSYSDESDLTLYKYFDGKIKELNDKMNEQAVYNATVNGALGTITNQISQLQTLVGSITKTAVPASAVCNFTPANSGCPVQTQ